MDKWEKPKFEFLGEVSEIVEKAILKELTRSEESLIRVKKALELKNVLEQTNISESCTPKC